MVVLWRVAACQVFGVLILVRSSQPASSSEGDLVEHDRWGSESKLLAHLRDVAVTTGEEESLALMRLCVSQSWWTAARELISRAHSQGKLAPKLESEVRRLMSVVKRNADDLASQAEATYRGQTKGLDEVHCAIQWAQNSTTIFLGVKYAARWSAPGAIEVVDVRVNITPCCFVLEGFGHHSSIRKRYIVKLEMYEGLLPENSSWSAASVGRLTATLQKAKGDVKWPRLVKGKEKHASKSQIGKWLDMEEKWENELKKAKAAKEEKKTDKKENKKSKDKPTRSIVQQLLSTAEKKMRRWSKKAESILGRKLFFGLSFALLGLPLLVGALLCRRSRPSQDNKNGKAAAKAAEARMQAETHSEAQEATKGNDGDPTED